jgi:RHS repeat-associated protein
VLSRTKLVNGVPWTVMVFVWGTKTTTTYSPLGQVASTTTSTANGGYSMTEKYTYTAGLLTHIDVTDSLSGAAPIVAADAVYDQASRLVSVRYSNGTTGSVQYGANEIPSVSTWTEAGGTPWTSSNDYSPAGRIMSSTVARAGAQSKFDYTYDTSARLASAALATDQASPAKAWQYTYDANSNRTRQVIDGAATIDYAYNKADQLTSLTGDPRLAGNVTYDSLGSITAIGPLQMTYDVNGNVAAIADSVAKSSVAYTRDANQSVIAKTTTTDGKASTIRYSASGLLLNADSQPIMQLVSLPGGASVQRAIAPAPGTAASQTWLYPSINGNTMFTTDGTGVSANAAPTLYDPFGQQLTGASTSPAGLPGLDLGWQGASGRQTEALSVPVTLMGARLYLPGLGRFTQVDPKVGGSANNYDYASQDPINGVDADGSAAWWKWVSAVAACIVISVVSAGATLALNASILAAGFSTVAATTLSLTAGAVVGAAGSVAAYAAQTAIVGSQWSWNDFAMAAIIGGLAGAYSGLAGMNNVGKTVLSGSLSAAKADGQIGLWKFAKALPGQIWNTGFGGTIKSTVAKYIVDPVQGSASLISLSGSRAFSAAANSAAKTLTCSALLSAAFKGVASAPGAVGGPIEGYHLEFKAGGFVVGTGATTLLGRFVCGG